MKNGKSGFLGALVAGFAAGYIILGLKKLCVKLPETIEKLTPVLIYPVAGILIIGLLMQFIVEPVMGGINTGLNSALSGTRYARTPALSRVDGQTLICPDCGTREALASMGVSLEEQEEIIETIHRSIR